MRKCTLQEFLDGCVGQEVKVQIPKEKHARKGESIFTTTKQICDAAEKRGYANRLYSLRSRLFQLLADKGTTPERIQNICNDIALVEISIRRIEALQRNWS